ncbi:MAG: putative baseplate assembly protein [Bradymonadales bacterium]|nr:putative baseplate assembly protein [Bradymonadales bacterium]
MIPIPNLDDRRYRDIVNEAISLIPKYCPDWTNHNPSDPGITLIELFAWMTEMIIYRLNRVGEKNYLAFLNLVGIRMRPPQPAVALVTFTPVEGAELQIVPEGTTVATARLGDEEPVVYETVEELAVLPTKLVRCYSRDDEDFTDNGAFITTDRIVMERTGGFDAFRGRRRIDRILYLGDERLENIQEGSTLAVIIKDAHNNMSALVNLVEWEYWNGRRWRELHPSPFELERGVVSFEGIEGAEATTLDGKLPELPWIRARLVEVPGTPEDTEIDFVTARVEVLGDGIKPSDMFVNVESNTYLTLDTSRSFYPFDRTPEVETALYVAHDELLSIEDAHIRIDIMLADPTIVDPPSPSPDLTLEWEYWTGKRWAMMARVKPEGVEEPMEGSEFADTTKAFTQTGNISFRRPKGMKAVDINGVEKQWIRVRIVKGDYGQQGRYELEGDTWVWKHERPLKPPALKDLTLKFVEDDKPFRKVFTYNDFKYSDVTDLAKAEGKRFQAFEPIADENPALFLGFMGEEVGPFPNRSVSIHFEVLEQEEDYHDEEYETYLAKRSEKFGPDFTKEQRIVWEYTDGKKWIPLPVTDHTANFTRPGRVEFIGPKKFAFRLSKRFGEELFWMRARLEMGGYDRMPRISRVLLNSVKVVNRQTVRNELVGSSRGTPNQRFELARKPLLEGEEIYIRESEMPTKEQLDELVDLFGDKAVEEISGPERGYWVRWRRVDTFYGHHRDSRVYVIDPHAGAILFGDGIRGMMPPEGANNIVARSYYVGGGARGNVGSYSINILRNPIPYIDSVTNHFPARGGADAETVEEVKQRGPHVIKSKDRAVTSSDFEWLAREASAGVARAKTVAGGEREGQVTVLILPKFEVGERISSTDLREKLLPSNELLRRVKAYLDERRLVSCLVNVEKPRYVEVSLTVELVRDPSGSSEDIKSQTEFALRKYLHPIVGGRNGRGWPFGRVLHKVDLYNVVEEINGVEFVDRIEILDEDRSQKVESVKLGPKELPHVIEVVVIEKSREAIRR